MLEFGASLGARDFEVQVRLADGETLAVLGPNGAGKSTLLEILAGLVRPDSGSARLDDRTLFDLGAGSAGDWMPPHRRAVALLNQTPLLFPRMSVRDNVAFGPQSTGAGRRTSRERAVRGLAEVDATDLGPRKPSQLSGGQAQRVAIARALACEPRVLLLDEPMASLDVTVSPSLRRLLRRVLDGQSTILVTHDVLDAYVLADRVAVMNAGRIVETGPTREVFERPRSPFTAALVGLNLLVGVATRGGLRTTAGHNFVATGSRQVDGTAVGGTLAPSSVHLSLARPTAQGTNSLSSTIVDLEPRGDMVRVNTADLLAHVTPAVVADLDLAPGMNVWCNFAASELELYDL